MDNVHDLYPASGERADIEICEQIIDDGIDQLEFVLDDVMASLEVRDKFRIHPRYDKTAERKEMLAKAARAALRSLLQSPFCTLPWADYLPEEKAGD